MTEKKIWGLMVRLWRHVSIRRRSQFGIMCILMVFASLAEIVSIAAVIPFLSALIAPETFFANAAIQPLIQFLDLETPEQILLPLTILFILVALVSGLMRLSLLWVSTRLSFLIGADFSSNIYRTTLCQPYSVHCNRNSSEVISGVVNKTDMVISGVIVPATTLITSAVMLVTILTVLIAVEPVMAGAAFGGFGIIYFIIILITRKRLLINGELISSKATQVVKSVQEGLGGIRDIMIDGTQEFYFQIFVNSDSPLRRAQGINLFISGFPRYGVETFGMVLIALIAYVLTTRIEGVVTAVPVLGVLALSAQKLLPIIQQAYAAWTSIRGSQAALSDILDLLDKPAHTFLDRHTAPKLKFERAIGVNSIGFRYGHEKPYVFNNVSFTILKGSKVGFIGTTGTGKSTLLDIITGLQQPTNGNVEIDGKILNSHNGGSWQSHIANVSQFIYLSDSTVAENIAFGIPKDQIDLNKVRLAAQQAQISESIETWSDKYQKIIGERGVRLSGGQRQRIGIARALYKKADVLVFDEATSALDSQTEQKVMEVVEALGSDVTLLIIAHRLTSLKSCDQIIEMSEGGKVRHLKYKDLTT